MTTWDALVGDEGRAAEKQPGPEVLLLLHGVTILRLAGLDVMGQACVIKCLFLPPVRSPTNMGGWGRSLAISDQMPQRHCSEACYLAAGVEPSNWSRCLSKPLPFQSFAFSAARFIVINHFSVSHFLD